MTIRPLSALLLLGLLAGCGNPIQRTTPHWDARFGDATRAAFAQQVINPAAAADPRPVTGTDGQSAAAAQQRYQKSYTDPAPVQGSFTIGIGGGK
ncbi:hypothetical protein IP92_03518 [Pseudoduganella flava]|uniref:Pilus assembly protein n=1 Tax=Pseudoduganella flava TaxID=871742 RepID=A0A562PNQ8_9BURK|nr:hypothetical protein [Pseudoduganella flava]QGZ40632.1 hypothetical protein GO485_17240 [Pseudoduganella flava]TWI46085.1 hypothetical protein IP92_03518 [Pseudoduganella flava]